jgi:GNAT superfamily N-acetyltransferase
MTENDTPTLVFLARHSDLAFVSRDPSVPAERLARLIAAGQVYVAERGGEAVGFARVEYLWSKLPFLALIWIDTPHRRAGVGRALFDAVEADARAAGHALLYSSSQADEPDAQAWHRQMGFTECGFLAGLNPGGVGEVFFRKSLTPPVTPPPSVSTAAPSGKKTTASTTAGGLSISTGRPRLGGSSASSCSG